MQGDPSTNRKPKHRADGEPEFVISGPDARRAFSDVLANLNDGPADVHDPADAAACNCDPLTDGYPNIECNTHGIPIQPR